MFDPNVKHECLICSLVSRKINVQKRNGKGTAKLYYNTILSIFFFAMKIILSDFVKNNCFH